jgi:hypothetical protein
MPDLTPISELSTYAKNEHQPARITWDVELPSSIDTERIAINTGHLSRVQKIAAFSSNHVFSFQGQQAEFEPSVAGINLDGTAVFGLGASITREADPSREQLVDPKSDDGAMKSNFTTEVHHRLNKAEMARLVSEIKDKRGLSGEEAWAFVLDYHFQMSIRRAAQLHLLEREPTMMRVFEPGLYGLLIAGCALSVQPMSIETAGFMGTTAAAVLMVLGHASESVDMKGRFGQTFLKDRRWSMFIRSQPDRYVAMSALTRVNRLVKVAK